MKLAEYQSSFLRAVRYDVAPKGLVHAVRGGGSLSAEQSLAVYREMYWFRLVEAHFEMFPKTAEVLGKKEFTHHVCTHLAETPSQTFALERLAKPFSDYLQTASVPHVAREVAMLESLWMESLLAPRRRLPFLEASHTQLPNFADLRVRVECSVRCARVSPGAFSQFAGGPAGVILGDPVHVVFRRPEHAVVYSVWERDEVWCWERGTVSMGDLLTVLAGDGHDPVLAFARLSQLIDARSFVLEDAP